MWRHCCRHLWRLPARALLRSAGAVPGCRLAAAPECAAARARAAHADVAAVMAAETAKPGSRVRATPDGTYIVSAPAQPQPLYDALRADSATAVAAALRADRAALTRRLELVDAGDDYRGTGLIYLEPVGAAAQLGAAAAIGALARAGADIEAIASGSADSSRIRLTPLQLAAMFGHADAVRKLIACGARTRPRWGTRSALDLARAGGHADVVALLQDLPAKADENATKPPQFVEHSSSGTRAGRR